MRPSTLAIGLLSAALVASNAWWVYHAVDTAVTQAYRSAELAERRQALDQALAVIKAASKPQRTRADIVQAAHAAWPDVEPFEKDGYLWVGRLGLRFDDAGQQVEAVLSD